MHSTAEGFCDYDASHTAAQNPLILSILPFCQLDGYFNAGEAQNL